MAEWPSVPSDNLYKFLTFAGLGIAVVAGGVLLVKLPLPLQTTLLTGAVVIGGAMCLGGLGLWFVRTQRHIDRRERSVAALPVEAERPGAAAEPQGGLLSSRAVTDATQLPLPSPAIQHGLTIWPVALSASAPLRV